MKAKILVIEDEQGISRFLSLELEHEGYSVTCESDGRRGLDLALGQDFDLLILDVMLPSLNGIEVLRRLRQSKDIPIIVLTARDKVIDKVAGLDLGASDYMTKPFAIEELLARVRLHLKTKIKTASSSSKYVLGKLEVDTESRTVKYDSNLIDLTKKEFDILVYLLDNKNIVITRDKIIDSVWGYDYHGATNFIDVYIRYIRSKIDSVYGVEIIKTVRGAGYVIRDVDSK